MLSLTIDRDKIDIDIKHFPAGETMLTIKGDTNKTRTTEVSYGVITMQYESNDDLINLMHLVDTIHRYYYHKVVLTLKCNYVPYSRQDRVCNKGESLSIKVFADIINSLGFDKVYTADNHSDVSTALINNCVNIPIEALAGYLSMIHLKEETVLVSPDAGANKKVYKFAKELGFDKVVRADKTRDVSTGKITGTVVYSENVGNKDFLIIDDILDGGYTFTELAKELRKLTTGKIMLYVTHGLFTKGLEPFKGLIDTIYVYNLMYKGEIDTNLIKVI